MNRFSIPALALLLVTIVSPANAQDKPTPLDLYFDTANTIVIAKCLSVGPMNILMRGHVELEILHMVKGKTTLRKISVDSQYGMEVGKTYLIRTDVNDESNGYSARIDTRDSVIEVSRNESIEKLKSLSPRIVVLRTMNLRIDQLESDIRIRTYELEALKAVKKGN